MGTDLILDGEWSEFKQAIGDVFQTFANTNVTIRKRVTSLSATNQSRPDNNNFTDTIIKAVFVQIGTDTDAQVVMNTKGSLERTESYILIDYKVFKDAGFIDLNGENTINIGKDNLLIRGVQYDILGVNQLGPLDAENLEEGIEAVVKIHLKKPISSYHKA